MRTVLRLCSIVVLFSLNHCTGCAGSIIGRGDGGGGPPDFSTGGGGGDGGVDGSIGGPPACNDGGTCTTGLSCKYNYCVPNLGTCSTNDDCPGDSYCDTDSTCVPYGVPEDKNFDPNCQRGTTLPNVVPTTQCEWSAPAAGDPSAGFVNIYSTPVVAELNLDKDPLRIQPSVVVLTFQNDFQATGRRGLLRVFDGRTCAEQMSIGRPGGPDADQAEPAYGAQVAIADLDGDLQVSGNQMLGHPEIVTLHRTPGTGTRPTELIAYRIAENPNRLERAWLGRNCTTSQPFTFGNTNSNYGPTIADLDDDGRPEIIVDRYVFDSNGCVLNPSDTLTSYITHGIIAVVADVDLDGSPELVRGDGVYGWNAASKSWQLEPYWQPAGGTTFAQGNVAVADFGNYNVPAGTQANAKIPEIVVVSAENAGAFDPDTTGTVRIQTITGQIVYGPRPLYADSGVPGGHGGPPTAADFDGDGLPEFAAAANQYYTVYDPDCVGSGDPTRRPNGRCTRPTGSTAPSGVLWGQPSQDRSSSITGSSVFDFNGDGVAEVVYRDECYLRVYNGTNGQVLYSSPASSGTGYELPVLVDVDGDFATEVVVARADNGNDCPSPDPLYAQSGNWVRSTGFIILRDPEDRWASSRPIWNQHAYSITNIMEDARSPRTSQVARNWEVPGLNNFRQNVQGTLGRGNIADLTVSIDGAALLCAGSGRIPLSARVCNRGTDAVADGAPAQFYVPGTSGNPDTVLCTTQTQQFLRPGECVIVSCTANVTTQQSRAIRVSVDPGGTIADCHQGNNTGAIPAATCPG